MKREFLIVLFLACSAIVSAQSGNHSLQIDEPNGWWGYSGGGTIEKAQVSIKPAGAYTEIGLYMTISARGGGMESYYDQLEIVMEFGLPEGSIMHDSWLWVGQDIMQGIIIDRDVATSIYEGIVNRRRDPSLLRKTGDHYHFRIYPMINGQDERKVKITYLVPNDIIGDEHRFPLPVNILETSLTMPDLDVVVYSNSTFSSAEVAGHPAITFAQDSTDPWVHRGTIPASVLDAGSHLTMKYDRVSAGNVFMSVHPTSATEGYYQLVCQMDTVIPGTSKKVVFAIEQFGSNHSFTDAEVIDGLRSVLTDYFTERDSFYIFVQGPFSIYNSGSVWIPADSALIEQALLHIQSLMQGQSIRNTYSLILEAQNFLQNHNGGEVVVISNNSNPPQQLWDPWQMLPITVYPVSFVHHATQVMSNYPHWPPASYVAVANSSGGSIHTLINAHNYWPSRYYTNNRNLPQLLRDQMYQGPSMFSQVDILPVVPGGYTSSRMDIAGVHNSMGVFVQTGKYYGGMPTQISFNSIVGGQYINRNWSTPLPYYDTLTHKIWADQYISQQSQSNISNAMRRQLNDTSIYHRVLWDYTAFLCLEPHDTLPACESCDPEGFDNENTVGIDDPDKLNELAMQVSPNPFAGQLNITLSLTGVADGETVEVYVVNLLGEVVKVLRVTKVGGQQSYTLTWDGTDLQGGDAAAGTYLIQMTTATDRVTQKVVKL